MECQLNLIECNNYLCGFSTYGNPILEKIQLSDNEEVALTWTDSTPAIQFTIHSKTSEPETLTTLNSLPKLQKKLIKNNQETLNKIANIINHLCNVEEKIYQLVPSSAILNNNDLIFFSRKGDIYYQVMVTLFEKIAIKYTPLNEETE